jgi:hypothetical protein
MVGEKKKGRKVAKRDQPQVTSRPDPSASRHHLEQTTSYAGFPPLSPGAPLTESAYGEHAYSSQGASHQVGVCACLGMRH